MLVFWKARLVLLAVPKTGTTAMETALAPMADVILRHPQHLKHMSVGRYRKDFERILAGPSQNTLDTVAVMREPIDWLHSWYRYRSRDAVSGTDRSTRGMDFETFAAAWLEDDPPEVARVGRQSRFLNPPPGAPGVDRLFRYDRQDALISYLEARLETAIDLPRLNVSPKSGGANISAVAERRLREGAADDFALWEDLVAATEPS